jgi:hypothetical protein
MLARVAAELGREDDVWSRRGVHGHVWSQNEKGRGFWAAVGMDVSYTEDEGSGGAVEGRAYEVDGEEGEWGYMRGKWGTVCEAVAARLGRHTSEPALVSYTYDNLEDMKLDKAVYKAVAKAIREEHGRAGGDGATLAQIVRETAEQRRAGRIRYVVVAEAPCGGRDGVATRANGDTGVTERTGEGDVDSGRSGAASGARGAGRRARTTNGRDAGCVGGGERVGERPQGAQGDAASGDAASSDDASRAEGRRAATRGKRKAAHLGADGRQAGGDEEQQELDVSMTPMGEAEAGAVWVRSGTRGGERGAKVWRAGRRRGWSRLADVNIERRGRDTVTDGIQSKHKRARISVDLGDEMNSDGEWSVGSRVGAVGTTSGSAHGSIGSGLMDTAVMEQAIDAAHKGQGIDR